ncbi:MAG: hypothetical protein GYA23_01420 [Methanomicrobiales archaeon]|nr:hypothetical protein [Methanomicrobiales archaeon]
MIIVDEDKIPRLPKENDISESSVPGTKSSRVSSFNGWIEYAYDRTTTSNPLGQFSAEWTVPSDPTSRAGTGMNARTIFLFNGIRDYPNYNTIIQPVLEWNNRDTGYYWTISSWALSGSSAIHSSRYTTSKDHLIKGTMQWDTSNSAWYVTTYDMTSGSSTSLTTSWTPSPYSSGLEPEFALEGWQITGNADVPGSTLFQNAIFKKPNGQTLPVVLKRYISSSSAPLTQLNVQIISNPSTVKLWTANL